MGSLTSPIILPRPFLLSLYVDGVLTTGGVGVTGDPEGIVEEGREGSCTGGVPALPSRFIPDVICFVADDMASLALAPAWNHEYS